MFLEECKCVLKQKKMSQHITDDIKNFSDSDRENSDEKILMKKIEKTLI